MYEIENLNIKPIFFWIFTILLLISLSVIGEFNDRGLEKSMYFHTLGYSIYPLTYGALIYGLFEFIRMLRHRNGYISHDGHFLYMRNKKVERLSAINDVTITQNALGIKSICVKFENSRTLEIRGYFLTSSLIDLMKKLNEIKGDRSQNPKGIE